MIAKRIKVIGRVQGVYFRASTKQEAHNTGLCGWVRNHTDGSVEIHVEGDHLKVDQLINWAHNGPRMANVERVDVSIAEPEGHQDFEIRK